MTISVNWQQDSTYPAATDRFLVAAAVTKSGLVTPRDGCLRTDALAVTAAGGSMNLTVAAGQAMVSGYLFTSDATVTVTPDVGGATDRTDLIIARVYDTEAGDANSQGTIEVVKGTSTSEPALPARSIKLAAVAVDASVSTLASGDLTDKRTFTTGAGGVLWLPGGLAAAPPSGLDNGVPVWDSSAGLMGIKTAGGWRTFQDVSAYATAGIATAGAAFTINTQVAQRVGPLIYVLVAVTYNTGQTTLTAQANGSVTATTLYTLSAAYSPKNVSRFPPFACQSNFAATQPGANWSAQVKSDGTVVVVGGNPTFQIKAGDVLVTQGTYLAAS